MSQAAKTTIHDAVFVATKETVPTFMMTIYGENLPITIRSSVAREPITDYDKGGHVTLVRVDVVAEITAHGRTHVLTMAVPVIKDGRYYRAADRFFTAVEDDKTQFLVWSNAGHYDQYNTIVGRPVPVSGSDTPEIIWYIGCGFESEVLFRCQYRDLPSWAKEVIMSDQEAKKIARY